MNFIELNLLEVLDIYGEEQTKFLLSQFECPKNIDVENFIRNKAINFIKQRIAITYLVFSETKNPEFVGYYSLANKFVSIKNGALGKGFHKRINKFAQYDVETNRYMVSMPLIAQLGRNFNHLLKTSIDGEVLLDMACNKVKDALSIIGGKMVYIECGNNSKLYNFYSCSNFIEFGRRNKENEEISESLILVQMLKYFKG